MHGFVNISAKSADFQRAFLALRYFWGARGAELEGGLEGTTLHPAAADALHGLTHPERPERARALGIELGRLAAELDARGLFR